MPSSRTPENQLNRYGTGRCGGGGGRGDSESAEKEERSAETDERRAMHLVDVALCLCQATLFQTLRLIQYK